MATRAIVGEKVGMTQVWDDDNRVVPVTVLRVRPCRVVQVKTHERDGYSALQVTFGSKKPTKLTKPVAGQFTGLWIYLIAPLLGGIAAAVVYHRVLAKAQAPA